MAAKLDTPRLPFGDDMNIFIFNKDFEKSAEYFAKKDFKRFNKQILESTQMIANFMNIRKKDGTLYKKTHLNHPCVKWTERNLNRHLCYLVAHLNVYEDIKEKKHACAISVGRVLPLSIFLFGDNNFEFLGVKDFVAKSKSVYKNYRDYLDWKLNKSKGEI